MAFKEMQSLDAERVTALGGVDKKNKNKPNPKTAEGYYLGSRKVASTKSKSGFAYIHYLQTDKGNLGVWGKTDLDRKILSVAPGAMIRITQTGMQPTPNGDMYKFKVEVDLENQIEVDLASEVNEDSGESEGIEDRVMDEYAPEDEVEEEVEEKLPARAASASKQSEVNAILKRRSAGAR